MLDTIQAQRGGQRRCRLAGFTRISHAPVTISLFAGQSLLRWCPELDRYASHWRPQDVEVSPGERCCSCAAGGHQRNGTPRRRHVSSQNPGISAAGRALGRTALDPASGPAAIGGMLQAGNLEDDCGDETTGARSRLSEAVSDITKLAQRARGTRGDCEARGGRIGSRCPRTRHRRLSPAESGSSRGKLNPEL